MITLKSEGSGNWREKSRRLAAAGGVTLTTASNYLTADVSSTGSANTFVDGPSVSLTAGTWHVTWKCNIAGIVAAPVVTVKLWDGTTTWDAQGQYCSNTGNQHVFAGSAIVVLAATTTVKLSFAYNTSGGTEGARMDATPDLNSPGNYASGINAVKVA